MNTNSNQLIKDLNKENRELRRRNEALVKVAQAFKDRRDYWRGRYYELVHNKCKAEISPETNIDIPDFLKGLLG